MGINWFEGGRRVSYLISGIGIIVGVFVLFSEGPTTYVVFDTETPDDPWTFTTTPCDYPDLSEYTARNILIGGKEEDIILCFRTKDTKILYKRAEQDTSKQWTYWTNDQYNEEVSNYVSARVENFRLTPEMIRAANTGFSNHRWSEWKSHAFETIQWTGAFLIFMLVLTTAVGWIVRGFAGIPQGHDFRPKG
ncbi:hypothetical protein M2336_000237 [Sphingobium sp. B1D7B]|uniref:hypothetical protein n=1 Tax=unclassified Sphingobium TaxID=2611147 RepID=UPI00222447A6|nr:MULTISPECIES: hypothetical protein [unclassified Sphingobium]MCW2391853.1 hypothetical protein [Sphingobium sp. B11D3A]MCW2403608.1 hypothetical protein [Sphingobium sp. B1D7B]